MSGAFLSGLVLGLILAVMTSPVSFALINLSITKGIEAGAMMIAGILTSNLVLFILLLICFDFVYDNFQIKNLIINITGIILIALGILLFIKKEKLLIINKIINLKAAKPVTIFSKGILINILSPFVSFFWIGIFCISFLYFNNLKINFILMFLGALLIVLIFDILKALAANKIRNNVNPKILFALNKIAGISIISLGIVFISPIF